MSARLLREFARRNRQQLTTAYDLALISYVGMLTLADRGRGTPAPLQEAWTRARDSAMTAERDGRCAPAAVPELVPVLLQSAAVVEQRAQTVREALAKADEREAYARSNNLPVPRPGRIDLDAETGLIVADVAHARSNRPIVALHLVGGEPRAIRVRWATAG